MQTRLLTFILSIMCLMTIVSCGDDVDCTDLSSETAELESVTDRFLELAFSDPTDPDVCEELRDVIEDLISLNRDIEDCVPDSERADFMDQIDTLEQGLDDLDCN